MLKYLNKIILSTLIVFSTKSFAHKYKYENCDNLQCVRDKIDSINEDIVKLLSLRMRYVYKAGDIKMKNNKFVSDDKTRANDVFLQIESLATKNGLEKEYVRKIFNIIVKDSIDYEQKYMDKKRSQ